MYKRNIVYNTRFRADMIRLVVGIPYQLLAIFEKDKLYGVESVVIPEIQVYLTLRR